MMNQGVDGQTAAQLGPNSHEYALEANHGQTSLYPPSTSGSETVSWAMHRVDNSTENGALSSSTYVHDQKTAPPSKNAQEGLNAGPATTNAAQDYNGYASYPNSTDPYGYGTAGYPSYYNSYQQQPNHEYSQQQPNNAYSQQQQPNNTYTQQQQPNNTHSQQQPNHAYSQPVGAYQNTGLPYQPISSFQNTGSYPGPTSYSSTYYNPGDYQTAGGYPNSSYSNQSEGSYANYAPQYPNYIPDSSGAYSSGTGASTSLHYQPNYNQYADYYSQTEVSCAPGTENLSVSSTSNQGYTVPSVSGGYLTPINQPLPPPPPLPLPPPPPLTSSWRPEKSASELPSVQPGTLPNGTQDGYWNQGDQSFQNHYATPAQPHFQKPPETQTNYNSFQVPQKSMCPQGTISQYPASHQVPQNHHLPSQALPSLDTQRVSKMQIQTKPRTVSNLPTGLPKVGKEGSTATAAAKPAYISVSVTKPDDNLPSHDTADSVLKPGAFPASLRGYVERALSRCKNDAQTAACQLIMKEIITKATADGTLHTQDWDAKPLFPLPNADMISSSSPISSLSKSKRSPSKRYKSRWEPMPEEKPVDKPVSFSGDAGKYGSWFSKERKPLGVNSEGKEGVMNNIKFSLAEQKTAGKFAPSPFKKQRLAVGLNLANNDDASSDSDKDQNLPSYYSGPMSLVNCPEEKKRRESRSKRFEKGQGSRAEINHYRPKGAGGGNVYTRRVTAVVPGKSFENGGSRAVEDIDWDALTVKGTCQEIEKRYLRLTSAPDPATVRPEEVLEKALLMVQNSHKNYLYKCDQLKSIRQDLTVQRIRNQLTVKVYETHARLAIEFGDLFEFNQCQSQLKILYAEGIAGNHLEFSAYNLLCVILHSNNNRDLVSSMARLSVEAKRDTAVKHALSVRAAVTSGNYVSFFRLYKTAPNLNTCLMDLYVEKMRYKAVSCMSRSYRPTIPVSYISQLLSFNITATNEESEEKDSDGLDECVEWLKAHGACLISDNNGEIQLDAKASSSSLYMPEPEDAVAHGDANLAVDDFFTRTSL